MPMRMRQTQEISGRRQKTVNLLENVFCAQVECFAFSGQGVTIADLDYECFGKNHAICPLGKQRPQDAFTGDETVINLNEVKKLRRRQTMKRIIAIVAAMVFLIALSQAYAKDYEISKKSGDYNIQVKIDKNPPAAGRNQMEVAIKDNAAKDITDAAVTVDYGMPAMPGMGAMNYKTNAELKAGKYSAALDFSMSGAWFVNIRINKAGKTQTVKLNIDVK